MIVLDILSVGVYYNADVFIFLFVFILCIQLWYNRIIVNNDD